MSRTKLPNEMTVTVGMIVKFVQIAMTSSIAAIEVIETIAAETREEAQRRMTGRANNNFRILMEEIHTREEARIEITISQSLIGMIPLLHADHNEPTIKKEGTIRNSKTTKEISKRVIPNIQMTGLLTKTQILSNRNQGKLVVSLEMTDLVQSDHHATKVPLAVSSIKRNLFPQNQPSGSTQTLGRKLSLRSLWRTSTRNFQHKLHKQKSRRRNSGAGGYVEVPEFEHD